MKLVIDSNIFVSSLDKKDIFYPECFPIFDRLINFEIEALCPLIVLIETTCVIRRKTKDKSLAYSIYKHLFHLPSINWLNITADVAERACLLGIKTGLKGGDSLVLETAEQYSIPLLTMDKEMKNKGTGNMIIVTPSELKI